MAKVKGIPDTSNLLETVSVGDRIPIGISSSSDEYRRMLPIWQKCRDAIAGEEAIKARTTAYLSMPSGMSDAEYNAYLDRASWYGASRKTKEAYLGMLYRKDPVYAYNDEKIMSEEDTQFHKNFFNSVTLDGRSFTSLMEEVTGEVMEVNKCGILIDYPELKLPDGTPQELTQAEVEQRGIKPVASIYKAEDIINWFYIVENAAVLPIFFVLREEIPVLTIATTDSVQQYERYRILYLENYNDPYNRRYKQILVGPQPLVSRGNTASTRSIEVVDITYPLMDGKTIPFIPFYVLTEKGLDYRSNTPSMLNDLVNMNIKHFRNSADLENELHWVGVKTAIFPGMLEDQDAIKIGGAIGVPPESKPFILEASSDSAIAQEMEKKEIRMAALGAQRLAPKGRYVESAETANISSMSETSMLGNMANAIAKSFSSIATFMLIWAGREDISVSVSINTDYYSSDLNGTDITQWFENVQRGNMSFDTVFWNLKRREVYPPDWSAENEINRIKDTGSELFGLADERFNTLVAEIDALKSLFGEGTDLSTLLTNAEALAAVANNMDTIKASLMKDSTGTIQPIPPIEIGSDEEDTNDPEGTTTSEGDDNAPV